MTIGTEEKQRNHATSVVLKAPAPMIGNLMNGYIGIERNNFMEHKITRVYKVLSTGKYCGDYNNGHPCPQHVTTNLGMVYNCGLFHEEDKLYHYLNTDNDGNLLRCRECLESFRELEDGDAE